ncbi:MAG: LamG domain-containing protein [Spirochaetia bacterium]|nr:LamG domain-containing protein [Spirochaetia bacterium]
MKFRFQNVPFFSFLLSFILSVSLQAEGHEEGSAVHPEFSLYSLQGISKIQGKDLTDDIVLSPLSHAGSKNNILYISFNSQNPFTLQEDSGKYIINHSSYIRSSDAVSGTAAHFSRLENKIIVNSGENSWPLIRPVKDFTIEMWIKPYHFYEKNEIFRKISLLDGKKIGLNILIERERLICNFSSLFTDLTGKRHNFVLKSRSRIKINRWTHIAVSFHASSGKVSLLINDKEESAEFARFGHSTGEMSFHPLDHSPIVIGEVYSGIIDEFRISNQSRSESFNPNASIYSPLIVNHRSMRGSQKTGRVISNVYALPSSRSGKFRYHAEEPSGSILDFRIRSSRHRFSPDTPESEIPWKRIKNTTDKLPPFRYIQWMAEMKSDPEGKHSPVLKEISIRYNLQKKPSPPDNLRVLPGPLENGQICLEWTETPEVKLNSSAGYRIYYGLRPNSYTGKLFYNSESGSFIRGESADSAVLSELESHEKKYRPQALNRKLKGKVRQCLNNRMVENNIYRIDPSLPMPFFRDMNAYYFSVSSWTKEGGESQFSNEVNLVLKEKPDL